MSPRAELGDRLNLDRERYAPEIEQARMMTGLQTEFANPDTTPERRSAIRQLMSELQGGQQRSLRDNVVVLGGGEDEAGRKLPQTAIDLRTMQPLGGGQSALPPGMVKQVGTANGQPVYENEKGERFTA